MATHAQGTVWKLYEDRYADLVEAVRQDHISHGKFGGGHDFTHALMVARYAVLIAEDLDIGRLAWIAAICHNSDRIYRDSSEEELSTILQAYLTHTDLTRNKSERTIVIEAVLEHHKPNKDEDSPVTVVLKDADRLANIGPNNIIRSGQLYNNLPAYDPRFVAHPDPRASYKNPGTVLHDVLCSLEWDPREGHPEFWIRLPKARALAEHLFDSYHQFKRTFVEQMQEVGFLDNERNSTYPFPEDLELAYKQEAVH